MALTYNFVNPKTIKYDKGLLVIDSDDGNAGDYNYWLPVTLKTASKHSQWIGNPTVVINPAINTATIGTPGKMTVEQLIELRDKYGWEMLSHGRHHVGLGAMELYEAATAGQTALTIRGAGQIRVEGGYTYEIYEGNTREIIKFVSPEVKSSTYSIHTMNLETPLVNSYTTAARILLTDESAHDLLQGCIDDLASWGFDCKHHVYTYHTGSQHQFIEKSVGWIDNYFTSGRGRILLQANQKNDIQLPNLISMSMGNTLTQIDTVLDETAATDGLFIFYGHGEGTSSVLNKLEYLIDGALSRGIRIVTRTEALKRWGLMN